MPTTILSRLRDLAGRAAARAHYLQLVIRDTAGASAWTLWFATRPLCRAPGMRRAWFVSTRERALLAALAELALESLAERTRRVTRSGGTP